MAGVTTDDATPAPTAVIDVPWELDVPVADLYIVGYGMRLPNDFTLETLAILKRCKRLLGVPPISAPAFGVPEMESLMGLYAPDKPRSETYREMVALALDAAADGPAAFVTFGSAMVGTVAAHRLLAEAPRRGLTVHVPNAVSFLDGIWADLNIEPFFGLQIWEATAFVRRKVVPDTKANLMLPQAAFYGVEAGPDPSTVRIAPSSQAADLQAYLLRYYPSDHVVHLATTGAAGVEGSMRSTVKSVTLGELSAVEGHMASTLVVPRLDASRKHLDFDGPMTTAARPALDGNGQPGPISG
jgi:uncharacterized protein YabN with tetrapyrrole methylase and pyrophosphatase domain